MSKLFLFICLFLSACATSNPSGLENIQSQLVEIHSQNLITHQALMNLDNRLASIENKLNLVDDKNLAAGKIITPQPQSKTNIVNPAVTTSPKPVSPVTNPTAKAPVIQNTSSPNTTVNTTNPAIPAIPAVPAVPVTTATPTVTEAPKIDTPVAPVTPVAKVPSALNAEQAAYSMALKLYQAGRYEEAEAAFKAFEASFAASSLLPNSYYWRGETLYARRLFAEAILVFKEIQALFPAHDKAADSLLKTALAYDRLADPDNAIMHYNVLAEDWPNSEALKRARKLKLVP